MLSLDTGRQAGILFVTQLRTFWLQQLKLILMVKILDYLNFILMCVEKKCERVDGSLDG